MTQTIRSHFRGRTRPSRSSMKPAALAAMALAAVLATSSPALSEAKHIEAYMSARVSVYEAPTFLKVGETDSRKLSGRILDQKHGYAKVPTKDGSRTYWINLMDARTTTEACDTRSGSGSGKATTTAGTQGFGGGCR